MKNLLHIFRKHDQSASRVDPVHDWIVLLISSAMVLSGIVVWNAWAFDTVATGGVIGTPPASTEPIFSQSSLDAIRTVFANRAAEEAKYVAGTYNYADPSQGG